MAGKIFCELILNDMWRVVIFIALLTSLSHQTGRDRQGDRIFIECYKELTHHMFRSAAYT
jgi:hypothetical protein